MLIVGTVDRSFDVNCSTLQLTFSINVVTNNNIHLNERCAFRIMFVNNVNCEVCLKRTLRNHYNERFQRSLQR